MGLGPCDMRETCMVIGRGSCGPIAGGSSCDELTLLELQFHRNQHGAESGADGEGAHLSDDERKNFDGWAEQPQHPLLCGEPRQGGAGSAVGPRGVPRVGLCTVHVVMWYKDMSIEACRMRQCDDVRASS